MATDLVQQGGQAQTGLFGKPAPKAGVPSAEIKRITASVGSRVKLVEGRLENIRGRIELIERSLADKHKVSIKEIKNLNDQMRVLRGEVESTKSLIERVAKRLDAFASDEEVKVLKRYVELWQPMSYVTRSEVKSIVKTLLKEGDITKDKEE